MKYLVEMALKQAPTPEILALIPAETQHGESLDQQGVREALYLSAERTKAWQVFRARDVADVERIVAGFPLAPYCAVNITPLYEQTAQ
jgi:muconolactone delta-isomerase